MKGEGLLANWDTRIPAYPARADACVSFGNDEFDVCGESVQLFSNNDH